MDNSFDVLVYLDENLVRNLSSLVLSGYIETITKTQSFDRTLSAASHQGNRIELSNQGSITKIERKGFKEKNRFGVENNFKHIHIDEEIDARQCIREEKQVRTTYTTFVLNNDLMNNLIENNKLYYKSNQDIESNNISSGDLIEIEGIITNKCLISYIDTLINLITIFGCDFLDDLAKKCISKINFSIILKMLTYLKSILIQNNTQDLIMESGNGIAVLTVNRDNFMNNTSSVFDKINCHCKVIGKVIKTCSAENDSISLLRKTGQEKFYENFFEKCKPLIECLRENDIFIPECPSLRRNECAIQIMPLNIYM